MRLEFHQIDAFTAQPFRGNPAAIILLEKMLDDSVLQKVANEMNLSDTAYLVRQDGGFHLRWFTPAQEVKLCGHATLASAHFLWSIDELAAEEPAVFFTLSGQLTARPAGEKIEMDFPSIATEPGPVPAGLAEALGAPVEAVHRNADYAIVDVGSEAAVRALNPDFSRLRAVETPGIMPTAPGDGAGVDFVSRFFAPQWGVDEDPVTGSAHCVLGPYWAKRLGRSNLQAHQASARGGDVGVETAGERVVLSGQAVTVAQGQLQF